MARLGDVPAVFKSVGVFAFCRRVWEQVAEDSLLTWAAALAYSWLFAVFPFFIFLMTLVPTSLREYRKRLTMRLQT